MTDFHLRYDPYAVFRFSRTPAGLYARQKWLGEAASDSWRADYDERVTALTEGNRVDGLWNGSILETISRLFGLHLTVRVATPMIHESLSRLLALAGDAVTGPGQALIPEDRLSGLPFAPGRRSVFVISATLFLAAIFGMAADPAVLSLYEALLNPLETDAQDAWEEGDVHNRLRALVVHPFYVNHERTGKIVKWLSSRQSPGGDWGPGIPFDQAVNALAHLFTPEADAQCRKAFHRLPETQNPDGTWGRAEREWSTFLVVHALRNKKMISP